MSSGFIHKWRLVELISVLQLKNASENISENMVSKYVAEIKSKFKIDSRITDNNLYNSARATLGWKK